jgi:hypothetical protein
VLLVWYDVWDEQLLDRKILYRPEAKDLEKSGVKRKCVN